MKKIFAILVSLLFLASVFGIASVMSGTACKCQIIGPASVEVGDTFQVVITTNGGSCCIGFRVESPIVKLIDKEPTPDGYILTYQALAPGNVLIAMCGTDCEDFEHYVTITPKSYPMTSL